MIEKYHAYASTQDKDILNQDHMELSVKVIEGFKNGALKCAMDVVVASDGVLKIAETIKASWAGKLDIVTKEIYHEGVLAR